MGSAFATNDPEFYRLTDDKYLVAANDEVYTMADKIEIDVNNPENNQAVYALYGVPEYLQDKINASITQQQAQGNEAFSIALYLPSFLEAPPAGVDPMDLQNPYAETAEYIWTDDNGHSHAIQNIFTQGAGEYADKEVTDDAALKEATAFLDEFILSSLYGATPIMNAFGVGMSALQAYEAAYGEVTQGNTADRFYALVFYTKTTKLTIIDDLLGCYTYKAYVDNIHTDQTYASVARNLDYNLDVRLYHYSENYDYSEETALLYAHPYAEDVYEDDLIYVLPSDGITGSTRFDGWQIPLV